MILGLTGGVGSGKSTVTRVLHDEYGFELLLTDDIAKTLELPGELCYEKIVKAFGEDILKCGYGSSIDNPKLAAKIYADSKALETINNIVHPAVWNYVSDYIDRAMKESRNNQNSLIKPDKIAEKAMKASDEEKEADISKNKSEKTGDVRIAVETALPNERFKSLCDEIWFIHTERDIRIRRIMSDRGYTREKSESIIAGQLGDEEFKAAADIVIDNSGDREATEEAVRARLKEILAI